MTIKKKLRSPLAIILLGILISLVLTSCQDNQVGSSPDSGQQTTKKKNEEKKLNKQIGQMIMVGFKGLTAGPNSSIAQIIKKDNVGGVILYSYNIESPQQLKQLTKQLQSYSKTPLFIAVDQEGGEVTRLNPKNGFKAVPSEQYLGTLNNLDTTRFYGVRIAKELSSVGINVDLAPVVDLNTNPDNPAIGAIHRSFSANPMIVTRNAKAEISEFQKFHIIATLKHFPGLGSAHGNPDYSFVDVTKTWQEKALDPYRNLISSGYEGMIMLTSLFNARLDTTYPAMFSKLTVNGILRDSLGFDGVVITDALNAKALSKFYDIEEIIKLCIQAGDDILLFAHFKPTPSIADVALNIINNLIKSGQIAKDRIVQSYKRIMKIKRQLVE
jgi:beta-N-acetylhexosaminidase